MILFVSTVFKAFGKRSKLSPFEEDSKRWPLGKRKVCDKSSEKKEKKFSTKVLGIKWLEGSLERERFFTQIFHTMRWRGCGSDWPPICHKNHVREKWWFFEGEEGRKKPLFMVYKRNIAIIIIITVRVFLGDASDAYDAARDAKQRYLWSIITQPKNHKNTKLTPSQRLYGHAILYKVVYSFSSVWPHVCMKLGHIYIYP